VLALTGSASALVPLALIGWGDAALAVGVGLALLASSVAATAIALALPWLGIRISVEAVRTDDSSLVSGP
jgi:hypothetical protein